MKKTMILAAVFLAVLSFGSTALAGTSSNTAGASISLQSGALNLNFSPGVFGQYTTEGATGNEQWFSIGTYHNGGTFFYATSSQQTTLWKKPRTSVDQDFGDANIPATKLNSESDTQWTAATWQKGG